MKGIKSSSLVHRNIGIFYTTCPCKKFKYEGLPLSPALSQKRGKHNEEGIKDWREKKWKERETLVFSADCVWTVMLAFKEHSGAHCIHAWVAQQGRRHDGEGRVPRDKGTEGERGRDEGWTSLCHDNCDLCFEQSCQLSRFRREIHTLQLGPTLRGSAYQSYTKEVLL